MFVHKIKSDGLSHLSYMIGSNGQAALIDPRRDVDAYMDLAREEDCRITHVFETHRNEDLVSGAPVISQLTGATVYHGPQPAQPIAYATTVREGDKFRIGKIELTVLETPGHTDDSVSYVLHDTDNPERAVGVFTGDALFIGDVGRTDFYPDREREVAGLLFDSLQKLKRIGPQAIIYPAHGAGSVCGAGMADREFSTIGHELANNQRFAMQDREAFIEAKISENHYLPPYFKEMERLNAEGGSATSRFPTPPPVPSDSRLFTSHEAQIVDIRSETDFAAAHVPGSYCIPQGMLAAFAGWFLNYQTDILLISDSAEQARQAAVTLSRIGFDRVIGHHAGTVSLATAGQSLESLPLVETRTVESRLADIGKGWTLLDVRSIDEFNAGHIEGATHAYVGHLPDALAEMSLGSRVTVMCGSGMRASIAASVIKRAGYPNVDVYYGSWAAWNKRESRPATASRAA
ncbi:MULTISPECIES: MBL fold metallo-hydrolase [Henriciella]|jgi:hydroxyacylglutathione hydrolase|uniref:MBL fold metallo-hydrolase n=1 Tax=Henriciella TaxID=453849 RepID=UPI00351105AF